MKANDATVSAPQAKPRPDGFLHSSFISRALARSVSSLSVACSFFLASLIFSLLSVPTFFLLLLFHLFRLSTSYSLAVSSSLNPIGYQSIDVSYDGAGFVGLVRGNYAHLDGADGFGFWYSVGSYELFNGLLPGPVSAGQTQGHATQRVELWVKRVQSPAVFDAGSGTACAEYATCAVVNGNASCVCPAGFTGNGEDACTDIDECALGTDTCSPNADCVNTAGGFSCFCREGFFGSGQTCEVDECASEATNDCDANAVCTKILGSFFCNCTEGYIGNGRSCVNVDECAGTPCHANATCTDVEGAFACRCNEGFDGDGTTSCEREFLFWKGGTGKELETAGLEQRDSRHERRGKDTTESETGRHMLQKRVKVIGTAKTFERHSDFRIRGCRVMDCIQCINHVVAMLALFSSNGVFNTY